MPVPELADCGLPAECPPDLLPRDYLILGYLFEGRKPKEIAADLRLKEHAVYAIIRRPVFKAWVGRIEDAIVSRISRGEFGAMAIAKRHATRAMQRIVDLSEGAKDERVRLNANIQILQYAGVVPQKPAELPTFDRLLDECSGDELEAFYRTGLFPARLANKLLRIAAPAGPGRETKTRPGPDPIAEAESLAAELETDEPPLSDAEVTAAEELVD